MSSRMSGLIISAMTINDFSIRNNVFNGTLLNSVKYNVTHGLLN